MRNSFGSLTAVLLGLTVICPAWAQDAKAPAASATQSISYIPPMRGAPDARISGGTRGKTDEPVQLDVIAPDHVGRTVQEQPTIYWFNSAPLKHDVEITVIADETNQTVFDTTISGPIPAGIHAIRLAGTQARLATNIVYQWSVTDKLSKSEPSQDIVTSGMIERVSADTLGGPVPPDGLAAAAAYAHAGVFYDAFAALSQEIVAKPSDGSLHQSRAALLAQVGLSDAAAYEQTARK